MRRHPVDAEQAANAHLKAKFFAELAAYGVGGRLVCFSHAAGQVPVGLVPGVNEQDAPPAVPQDHVSTDALACLLGVALGKIGSPRLRIAFVQWRFGSHRHSPLLSAWLRMTVSAAGWVTRRRRAG